MAGMRARLLVQMQRVGEVPLPAPPSGHSFPSQGLCHAYSAAATKMSYSRDRYPIPKQCLRVAEEKMHNDEMH